MNISTFRLVFILLSAFSTLFSFVSRGFGAPPMTLNSNGQFQKSDGTLYFPITMFSVLDTDIPKLPGTSFNTICDPYPAQGFTSTPHYLRIVRPNGFFLIPGLPSDWVQNESIGTITQYVNGSKDDAHLLAWYNFEEPASPSRPITVAQGKHAYQAIKAADPARPVIVVDYQAPNVSAYKDCYDIFGWDGYPIGSNGDSSIKTWRDRMKSMMAAAAPKAVWPLIQAFALQDNKYVLPTRTEEREMAYESIIQGATGLVFYLYGSPSGSDGCILNYPDFWAYVQTLGRELERLSPVFLAPANNNRVSVDRAHASAIDVSLRVVVSSSYTDPRDFYLIAANIANTTPAVNYHYPGVKQSNVQFTFRDVLQGQATLVGDAGEGSATAGRTIPLSGGKLTDTFDPYAVHIYKITPTSPSQ